MAVIIGTSGNDTLNGTIEDDIIRTGLGRDIVDGGDGIDLLEIDYSASDGRIFYTSSSVPDQGVGELRSGDNRVTFNNVEIYSITGSQFNDEIFGGDFNDTLSGGRGNDVINGGKGADVLDGESGNDTLVRNLSSFNLGSIVDNTVSTMTLIDGTTASNFENINLTFGSGDDTVKTGLGRDIVDGGDGIDLLEIDYSASDGRIFYTSSSVPDQGVGELRSGNNRVTFNNVEIYSITGSQFNDEIFGGNFDDTLSGGLGNDVINGGNGNDIAVFAGNISEYEITRNGTTTTVINISNRGDGTDILLNIEEIQFSDFLDSIENLDII